jgi:hypothetical protein
MNGIAQISTKQKGPASRRAFLPQLNYLFDGGGDGCASIGVVVGCGVVLAGCTPGIVGAALTVPFAASARLIP